MNLAIRPRPAQVALEPEGSLALNYYERPARSDHIKG